MKKLVFSIIALLLVPIFAVSEEIDLSAMTMSELIELDLRIEQELQLRDYTDGQYLYQGTYEVGRDIEPGRYVFKCEKILDPKYDHGDLKVRSPGGGHKIGGGGARLRLGDKWTGTLEETELLNIYSIECSFVKID